MKYIYFCIYKKKHFEIITHQSSPTFQKYFAFCPFCQPFCISVEDSHILLSFHGGFNDTPKIKYKNKINNCFVVDTMHSIKGLNCFLFLCLSPKRIFWALTIWAESTMSPLRIAMGMCCLWQWGRWIAFIPFSMGNGCRYPNCRVRGSLCPLLRNHMPWTSLS